MIILQYHDIFQAVRLRKSHDIIILSFCNIVKGQAKCLLTSKFLLWCFQIDCNIFAALYIIDSNGT